MATLRGLIAKYGIRGATRALKNAGINQPSGNAINERYIRESVRGRLRNGKRVAVPQNEAFINQKISATEYVNLPDLGEREVKSGAETHGQVKKTKDGAFWIGEYDTREREVTRELTKFELEKLFRTAGLDWNKTLILSAFGDYLSLGTEDYQTGSDPLVGENAAVRKWIAVKRSLGFHIYDLKRNTKRQLPDVWGQTEAEIVTEILEVRRTARDLARFQPGAEAEIEKQVRAIQRGGVWNGIKYPSFAARFMTNAGARTWIRVHAAEVRLAL